MFHCFEVRALDYPKLQKGRILFLIALHNNRMAVINEFNNLTVLKLPFSKPIVNINIPFNTNLGLFSDAKSKIGDAEYIYICKKFIVSNYQRI